MNDQDVPQEKLSGCLARIFWMILGNLLLLSCAAAIGQNRSGFFAVADVFYWATVGGLLVVRYADIRYLNGDTANGDPASMTHWRRYAAILFMIATVLWGLAHVISFSAQMAE